MYHCGHLYMYHVHLNVLLHVYLLGMCNTTKAYHCQKYHDTIQYHDIQNNMETLNKINILFGCICQEMVK